MHERNGAPWRRRLLIVVALLSLVAAACGSDDDSSGDDATAEVDPNGVLRIAMHFLPEDTFQQLFDPSHFDSRYSLFRIAQYGYPGILR